ncbi:diaminopimelate decarboxylase [Micromonospora sp. A200]|uniref:alanine racemase n=1 Tax=Micromonospora sp. A200 TaxID=2940568 RepID=UPI00247618E0|nr:alanine racemase [Micromonospora sp. A200]MDH6464629.1 diaminopimelate decarboxylase [Micromonospora sp. A200]
MITPTVRAAATAVDGPTYLYDLAHLDTHLASIRVALPKRVELLYAMKANPDARLLAVIAQHTTGIEVASGGELAHLTSALPGVPVAAFGGPGKTDTEISAALAARVHRFHVESPQELHRLDGLARATGRVADVLLRVNLPITARDGPALVMGGAPSPFGMDPTDADDCVRQMHHLPGLRLRGVHAHLASGLTAADAAATANGIVDWALRFAARNDPTATEVNVGGGMVVDYTEPDTRFDWSAYGSALRPLLAAHPTLTLRIEPGRAVAAYSGWYATRVLDVKRSQGEWFAVVAGGTHHLRTPAAKGHDQPFVALPIDGTSPATDGGPVTVVGQLCTPKDVLARRAPVRLAIGDVVVFAMAGAYAWNISHQNFLMHQPPVVRYLDPVR